MFLKVKPSNLGLDYFDSSRRRLLTWVSLLGSGLMSNLALAAPINTSPGTGDDGTKPTGGARDDIRTKQQDATDSIAVTDVIMRERLARETHNWADDAACFHPDAVVEVSWFKGSGAEFVEAGKNNPDTETVHFDSMSPAVVWLKDDRAIADTACAVHTFSLLEGIEVSTTSYTRLLWRVQRSQGQWLIRGLRGIYIRDTLIPRDPNKVPKLDEEKLRGFRPSYRYLSYILTAGGSPAHNDLPGVDRPEIVAALRAGERAWLQQG
ncbi:nuclear transport factor 2 family protein [Lichenifustis flavocetrariae]|uniref:Nuclear transport factor 2 family protein n=1 Tax=Lichenifustis flavocetrariae TaxID=2949735 RepID=A0AA41Z0N6_9HYPH|nr:nuclear transport factor 2 family protein [Lichenifustis flavocetrariae]MCW6512021.1 nuclear transport factor 2 family protein [Lichenifustis flavocetrariae]